MPSGAPWTLLVLVAVGSITLGTLGLQRSVDVVVVGLQLVFVVYFLRHLAFAVSASRSAPLDLAAPAWQRDPLPTVTVLVPCHNEETVAAALVAHLRLLDYPPDQLQLIVVDDRSTDRTAEILAAEAGTEGGLPGVEVVHRVAGERHGKSAALNAGLEHARGEIVVVFDADHRPRPDVLRRLVRHFSDPEVAAVQGRCVIRNRDDSLLARLVAIDYLAGYLVNEYGRQSLFGLPAYGGANCAVRRSALEAVGGWNPDSVTEDTDLTLRLVLRGQIVRYDISAVDEEEGVTTLGRYWRQRYRWARGHQQVWRDQRWAVVTSPRLSLPQKVETVLFLLAFHLPVVAVTGFLVVAVWVAGWVEPVDPTRGFVLWTLLFLGPLLEVGTGLLIGDADRRDARALVFFVPLYFVAMAVCSKAWLDGVLGRSYAWVRTARRTDPVRVPSEVTS